MVTQKQMDQLISRIVDYCHPQQIILFGSYAGGRADENSDLDLLIIKETNEAIFERAAGIRKNLRDFIFPMDILVYTPSEIEKDKGRKFTFIHDILKSGKLLYAEK